MLTAMFLIQPMKWCAKNTGYAESCYVEYDENHLSLEKLLIGFWAVIDPTI